MILDNIKNSALYENIHPRFIKAFEYLHHTNFTETPNGTYHIDGENIFAIVQEYYTKDKSTAKLEAHKKYIDIQFMYSGTELMGVNLLENQIPVINDPEKDLAFYDDKASFVKLEQEMFAIFFPHDLHMPGIQILQPENVKKIVIKVKV